MKLISIVALLIVCAVYTNAESKATLEITELVTNGDPRKVQINCKVEGVEADKIKTYVISKGTDQIYKYDKSLPEADRITTAKTEGILKEDIATDAANPSQIIINKLEDAEKAKGAYKCVVGLTEGVGPESPTVNLLGKIATLKLTVPPIKEREPNQFKSDDKIEPECKYSIGEGQTFAKLEFKKGNAFYTYEKDDKKNKQNDENTDFAKETVKLVSNAEQIAANDIKLTIEKTTDKAAGNYTCTLSYKVGAADPVTLTSDQYTLKHNSAGTLVLSFSVLIVSMLAFFKAY